MEINGNEWEESEIIHPENSGKKQIRNCKTSGNSRVFCRDVAS
jgi:hypothetical protein